MRRLTLTTGYTVGERLFVKKCAGLKPFVGTVVFIEIGFGAAVCLYVKPDNEDGIVHVLEDSVVERIEL